MNGQNAPTSFFSLKVIGDSHIVFYGGDLFFLLFQQATVGAALTNAARCSSASFFRSPTIPPSALIHQLGCRCILRSSGWRGFCLFGSFLVAFTLKHLFAPSSPLLWGHVFSLCGAAGASSVFSSFFPKFLCCLIPKFFEKLFYGPLLQLGKCFRRVLGFVKSQGIFDYLVHALPMLLRNPLQFALKPLG
jgi:hypothetical protein